MTKISKEKICISAMKKHEHFHFWDTFSENLKASGKKGL